MTPEEKAIDDLRKAVDSARTLRPTAFNTAVDPSKDIKQRWTAFDEIYEFVAEEMERNGTPIKPVDFPLQGLSEQQVAQHKDRSKRFHVAIMMLTIAYGNPKENLELLLTQAEELVPVQPDPDTLRIPLSSKDSTLLFHSMKVIEKELPEDWACFFKAESEPVERRKLAFSRIYACVGAVWLANSDFAKQLKPIQRQAFVVLALMSTVPKDQWTDQDLHDLETQLLPVEEPNWDNLPTP